MITFRTVAALVQKKWWYAFGERLSGRLDIDYIWTHTSDDISGEEETVPVLVDNGIYHTFATPWGYIDISSIINLAVKDMSNNIILDQNGYPVLGQ